MDEKTEELRDIFLEVADEETVTESQSDERGTLRGGGDIEEQLRDVISEMDDRFEIETSLDESDLVELVRGFYDGDSDTALADRLDVSRRTVVRARVQLHLIRDRDRAAPFDVDEAIRLREGGATMKELATRYEASESTIRRYLRVKEMDQRSRQVNQRYRTMFDSIIGDSDIATRLTEDVHEDGLEDATEGMESNVSF